MEQYVETFVAYHNGYVGVCYGEPAKVSDIDKINHNISIAENNGISVNESLEYFIKHGMLSKDDIIVLFCQYRENVACFYKFDNSGIIDIMYGTEKISIN